MSIKNYELRIHQNPFFIHLGVKCSIKPNMAQHHAAFPQRHVAVRKRHFLSNIQKVPCLELFPVNTKHLYDISTMLDQRQRRWANVVYML